MDNLQSQNLLDSGGSSGGEISTGPHFNFSVPLKHWLGFAEDYKKVLLHCKHELVLMLTKNLCDVFEQTRNEQTFKLEMTSLTWKIPLVTPSDFAKIKMCDIIKSGVNLPIAFRSWDSYVIPKLGYGSQHSWNVELSANREKPRFAILGFTLNGELITNNFSNLKVYLNSESYPNDNLNVEFSKNQHAHLYEMYTRFQSSYYNRESQPFLTTN